MELKNNISKIKELIENTITFEKAEKAKIDFINAMLKNNEFSIIPYEYEQFLVLSNGLIALPCELYGTETINRQEYNYKFPNIIDANKVFIENKNPLMKNRVMLGTIAFDIIIFDANDNKFKILNRFNFETIETFSSFNNILDYIVNFKEQNNA